MNKYKHDTYDDSDRYCLDFEKISKEYDAFHLTEKAFYELRLPIDEGFYKLKYEDFYNYDAETWIIFNLNAINKGSVFVTHTLPIFNESLILVYT
jgi:hypothetical protein